MADFIHDAIDNVGKTVGNAIDNVGKAFNHQEGPHNLGLLDGTYNAQSNINQNDWNLMKWGEDFGKSVSDLLPKVEFGDGSDDLIITGVDSNSNIGMAAPDPAKQSLLHVGGNLVESFTQPAKFRSHMNGQ